MATYPRRRHYEHYISMDGSCTYSVTTNIDITMLQATLKKHGLQTFPTHLWLFSQAVNDIPEFRMAHNDNGELGIWERVNPRYNVFNEKIKTFGGIWTEHSPDFREFYYNCVSDMARYKDEQGFELMTACPNVFDFSCLPWINFTGFNLNIYTRQSPFTWLAPQITIGKFAVDFSGRLQLPLSVQSRHAVCDGYHVGKFIEKVQQLVQDCEGWL